MAYFGDSVRFENLPNGQSYFNFIISAAVITPQGASEVGVSEVATLQGRFNNQCGIYMALSGACSAIVPIDRNTSVAVSVTLSGQAQVTSPGLAGFLAGFGKHPYPTGGKVVAAFVQDANGKPVEGVRVVSSSGYKYPSKYATATTLNSKPNPSKQGQFVVFTATPASLWPLPPGSVPTGTVVFKDGATVMGTARLQTGVAKFRTSALSGGTHQITAVYKGDQFFGGSTSPVLNQIVN